MYIYTSRCNLGYTHTIHLNCPKISPGPTVWKALVSHAGPKSSDAISAEDLGVTVGGSWSNEKNWPMEMVNIPEVC